MSSRRDSVGVAPDPVHVLSKWAPCIIVVWIVAALSLAWLRQHHVFLLHLPFDREASQEEVYDARVMSRQWFPYVAIFLTLGAGVVVSVARSGPLETLSGLFRELRRQVAGQRMLYAAFAVTCLLDLATTWAYCQKYTLADELHPAIKLMGYAYGLTVGVVAAKLLQAALVLLMTVVLPRWGRLLLVVTMLGYAAAAVWNGRWL